MDRHVGLGITLVILLMADAQTFQAESKRPGPDGPLTITVAICDKTGMDLGALSAAERHAAWVLRAAGIELEWTESQGERGPATFRPNSLERCALPAVPTDFVVVIAPESPEGWSPAILGFAQHDAHPLKRAYILENSVSAFVEEHQANPGAILGYAVAHELGHLLMPGVGHSSTGIMRTAWGESEGGEAARGMLRFDPVQAQRMQARIRSLNSPDYS